jgi:hypothetical protein
MPTNAISLRPPRDNRGGPRPGAGRKSQWPTGTAIKTMRFPAVLEDELCQQQFPEPHKIQHSSGIPTCLFVNLRAKMGLS